ncbi:hypothetical protein GLAREA_03686 [Glarea lozoyensis ATCC 20868]|uniref:Uncharacterized protein n=1 Tax=Glarea lozoyensis (strain ATCC 20868 / MF5171) TaxID=1116229 RepID=S3D0N6_GLAL2|nr:uncharacterized protein GLAREA_03686 [Glarea lozoyensis ATCC 20868]EPE30719.1 hypothetical protein GLAREA_03686 [Glarea lozoyensis ATCC 20868]
MYAGKPVIPAQIQIVRNKGPGNNLKIKSSPPVWMQVAQQSRHKHRFSPVKYANARSKSISAVLDGKPSQLHASSDDASAKSKALRVGYQLPSKPSPTPCVL